MNTSILDSCSFLDFKRLSKDGTLKLDRRQDRRKKFLLIEMAPGACDVFEAAMFQKKSQKQSHSEGFVLIRIPGRKSLEYDIAAGTVWIPGFGTRKAQIFDPKEATPEILFLREASLRGVIEQEISRFPQNLQNRAIRRIEEMVQFPSNSRFSAKENLMLVREHHLLQLSLPRLSELKEWLRFGVSVPPPSSVAA
jgi:hypothetical protein